MYERSQEVINSDINELETMTKEFKTQSSLLKAKHMGQIKIVEEEIMAEEGLLTQSGKIDLKRITQKAFQTQEQRNQDSFENLDMTDKFSSISYRGGQGGPGGEPYNDKSQIS